MLTVRVTNARQTQQIEHPSGPLEFGRNPQRDVAHMPVDDDFVSRSHLRVEELPDGRLLAENLSHKNPVALGDGSTLSIGTVRKLDLPTCITIGNTRIEVRRVRQDGLESAAYKTIARPAQEVYQTLALQPLRELGDSPAAEQMARWLETVISLQRSAVGTVELYAQSARALVELVGMDLGLVVLRNQDNWEVVARHARSETATQHFSRSLLDHVVRQRQTFYQDLESWASQAQSLHNVDAVVVSPIFGLNDDAIGVLYGARDLRAWEKSQQIRPLDAQLVQLLAAAVGSHLARTAAARTRVQFEQFFSPELVRELERDPNLLEGKNQEVTILCSDLRGFSRLSERLGAADTCRLVRDMMERLTERIVEHGGVIVDYAGDGILAMWNAPAVQADHATRAARAALAMLGEMPGLNERWHNTVGDPLVLGIGLSTGPAQVGNTGSNRKFKYGPHGHTVNVASRVQDATKRLGLPVLLAESTRSKLAASFATRRLGQVRLAGMQEAVTLYELYGEGAPADWLARRDAYESALTLYEEGHWSQACQSLIPLLAGERDTPALKLMRRASECLEAPPQTFDRVIDVSSK
jgi:adenylate cyclase